MQIHTNAIFSGFIIKGKIVSSMLFIALSVALVSPARIVAEDSAVRLVATVDIDTVLRESSRGKAVRESLEQEARDVEQKLNKERSDLAKSAEDLERQKAILSAAALESKRAELEKRTKDLQRDLQDAKESLTRKNGAALQKIVSEIREVVKAVAAQEHIGIVVERSDRTILYASERIDITPRVLEAFSTAR
jgi:Skp family chaperone for outer membrane proteins